MKKRARPQVEPVTSEQEGRSSEEGTTAPLPAPKRSRAADPTPTQVEPTLSNPTTTALGLEAVGDDVLLLIMDLCGPTDSLRAFLLANHRLHALLRSHRTLWRRAYTRLFDSLPRKKNKTTDHQAALQHHLAGVEDYFEAYMGAMRKWTGKFRFNEDGVPLGESDGELTIKVGPDGRSTWEGYGIGCGRAGEYTSLNCLKGEGALALRFNKKGAIQAFAKGHERSLQESCERHGNDDDDDEDEEEDDDDDDDDDDEDEELDEKARKEREKEREKKREERQKEKEEREKEKEREREERRRKKEEDNDANKWLDESLHRLKPPFFSPVKYKLHTKGKRRWCTGGGACREWHEDMEW